MNRQKFYPFIVILLIITSCSHTTSAVQYYDDEYKFLFTIDEWMQASGYENNSYSYATQFILEVIDYTEDNITYIDHGVGGMHVQVYNYSMHEYFSLFGPIGHDFIDATNMVYYYDLWNNGENLTDAYIGIIRSDYTADIRYAANYLFKANLSILIEDPEVDFLYDPQEEEIVDIPDTYTLSHQISVEYDTKGVLLKWKEITTVDGNIIQFKRTQITQRVDDFSSLELTSETSLASPFITILSLVCIFLFKRKKHFL